MTSGVSHRYLEVPATTGRNSKVKNSKKLSEVMHSLPNDLSTCAMRDERGQNSKWDIFNKRS